MHNLTHTSMPDFTWGAAHPVCHLTGTGELAVTRESSTKKLAIYLHIPTLSPLAKPLPQPRDPSDLIP
jgi:hypothetical protein